MIIKSCKKAWPGNGKVLFKGNEKNMFKLEELVKELVKTCSMEEIGFGHGEYSSLGSLDL